MKYATFRVTGKVTVAIDDSGENSKNTIYELLSRASKEVSEMDFGPLSDIDWEERYVEDENGNRVYDATN